MCLCVSETCVRTYAYVIYVIICMYMYMQMQMQMYMYTYMYMFTVPKLRTAGNTEERCRAKIWLLSASAP